LRALPGNLFISDDNLSLPSHYVSRNRIMATEKPIADPVRRYCPLAAGVRFSGRADQGAQKFCACILSFLTRTASEKGEIAPRHISVSSTFSPAVIDIPARRARKPIRRQGLSIVDIELQFRNHRRSPVL
jgi:hypothetical protein